MALEGAHLFRAELLEEGSFADLIHPAVKSTLNVLGSCAKVPAVKRVVITSSMAAVFYSGRPLSPDVVVDETRLSDPAFCEKSELWYMLSKTLAEQEAWKFTKENGIDLVTINPGYVIDPILQPTLNTTIEMIFKLVNGSETYPNSTHRYVDIAGQVTHCRDSLDILRKLHPTLQLPEKCQDDKVFGSQMYQVSKEKAKGLGLEFTPLEVTLKYTVESFKEKGFI
ncbi:hypothetical protein CDL15_Pgr009753 [Punica granatum]|uniref:Thioester reductase (TE) domain-containing protein n=1 Tax=Punica granatum TaxID=22663 RepID=A0A218WTB7_PUNGR|nr:hypothetical protein CDL15_Pgr009753 [Punica granatum]